MESTQMILNGGNSQVRGTQQIIDKGRLVTGLYGLAVSKSHQDVCAALILIAPPWMHYWSNAW